MNNSNEVLLNLLDLFPGHVFWLSNDGVILGANDSQAVDLGFTNKFEIINKHVSEVVSKKSAEELLANNKKVVESGLNNTFEEIDDRPDGSTIIYRSHKIPLKVDDNIIGVLGVSVNISAEKQNVSLKKELALEQEVSEKTRMWAGAIAHEVRTPLAALDLKISILEMMINNITQENSEKHCLKSVSKLQKIPGELSKILSRAKNIIKMTLMKARSGSISNVALVPTSLKSAVEEALREYPFQKGEKELVHVSIPENIFISSNQEYFEHVIFNLIKNSLFFVKKAQKGEIFISAVSEKNSNILIFKDTALGVDGKTLEKLFTPFFTQTSHGTGVGLNLIKNIVEAFGGSIVIKSEYGEHMTFEMSFPIEKVKPD